MAILVLGINHKTASVTLRGKLSFNQNKIIQALGQLNQQDIAKSAVILSTCNRTEIYLHNKEISPNEDTEINQNWVKRTIDFFINFHQVDKIELQNCLYVEQNIKAIDHLMSVACGLDSLILGEPQILGQVKQAFQYSLDFYKENNLAISTELSRLFEKTFQTAKRVRTETNIGGSAVSVAFAATQLARQIFDDIAKLNILLVGAGETIELVARYLMQNGAQNICIANRTVAHAHELTLRLQQQDQHGNEVKNHKNLNAEIMALTDLDRGVARADLIISSTGSDYCLIDLEMVENALKIRRNKPILIVDIAIPRDVAEEVGDLDAIYYYSVDDLKFIIDQNLEQRKIASVEAKKIIEEEAKGYFSWLKIHQSSNLIKTYRQEAENNRQDLLEKARIMLQSGNDPLAVLEQFSNRLMNKLIHPPTQIMHHMVKNNDVKGLQNISKILKIKDLDEIKH